MPIIEVLKSSPVQLKGALSRICLKPVHGCLNYELVFKFFGMQNYVEKGVFE